MELWLVAVLTSVGSYFIGLIVGLLLSKRL